MVLKRIAEGVIVLLLALLIFSYITNASFRDGVNSKLPTINFASQPDYVFRSVDCTESLISAEFFGDNAINAMKATMKSDCFNKCKNLNTTYKSYSCKDGENLKCFCK